MSSVVIIPTTGAPELAPAIDSVLRQTVPTTCYVVCDGDMHAAKVRSIVAGLPITVCVLPQNVGANGFNGHRIYAAFAHLVAEDHVLFLDEDNRFNPTHVQRCVALMETHGLQWCYSLRNICDPQGRYLCRDDCESLGVWPTYSGAHLIDTNCYCIRREVLIRTSQVWHGGWSQDRIFTLAMMQRFPNHGCTGHYTVDYCLSERPRRVTREFFEQGNAAMHALHGPHPPWRDPTCCADTAPPPRTAHS